MESIDKLEDVHHIPQLRGPRRSDTLPVRFEDPVMQPQAFNPRSMPPSSYRDEIYTRRRQSHPAANNRYRERSLSPEGSDFESDDEIYTPLRRDTHPSNNSYPRPRRSSKPVYYQRRRDKLYQGTNRPRPQTHKRTAPPVIINNTIFNDAFLEDDEQSEELYPDLSNDLYLFSFSRDANRKLSSDSAFESSSEALQKETGPIERSTPANDTALGKAQNVFQSQYTGDGLIGGLQAAKLVVIPDGYQKSTTGLSPIFRWIHFEDPNMDFDNFQNNAVNITGLTDNQRTGILKLLRQAKKGFDRPLQISQTMKARFMAPSLLQETLNQEDQPKSSKVQTIAWICLPYFVLEKYFSNSSGIRPSSHPIRTLAQARFSLAQKERDMQQAVCQLPGTPPEYCFYIAQTWFLVLDDSLLISCATASMKALQGEAISIVLCPSLVTAGKPLQRILVSSGNSLLWSVPLNECQSWFAFNSHFWEYWPRKYAVLHSEKIVCHKDWPRIFSLANKSTVHLSLDFRVAVVQPAKGILVKRLLGELTLDDRSQPDLLPVPAARPSPPTRDSKLENNFSEAFHVFTWLNTSRATASSGIRFETTTSHDPDSNVRYAHLNEDLHEIENFLSEETSLNERLTYKRCPMRTRRDLYSLLEKAREKITSGNEHDQALLKDFEDKVSIINAAVKLFLFFLPLDFEGPTALKFWGSLYAFLEPLPSQNDSQSPNLPSDDDNVHVADEQPPVKNQTQPIITTKEYAPEVIDRLELLAQKVQPFVELFNYAQVSERPEFEFPEIFPRAWCHLLMGLVFSEEVSVFDRQMVLCEELLERGMSSVVQQISKSKLSDNSVFKPSELASLITFQLCSDVTGNSLDIGETYWEYLRTLEAAIESNPLDRGHQDRIAMFKQEVSIIIENLRLQRRVLRNAPSTEGGRITDQRARSHDWGLDYNKLELEPQIRVLEYNEYDKSLKHDVARYDIQPMKVPKPPPIDPGSVQGLLKEESLDLIDKRIKDFQEMNERISDLEIWNMQKIDSNKDRQESAVYAFTVVTIIFLPLSTIASILGMNTADIRNMDITQWVFWTISIPLAIIIITLCLVWAGELENFWNSFTKLWRNDKGKYKIVADAYSMTDPRAGLRPAPGRLESEERTEIVYPVQRMSRSHPLYGRRKYK